ncbi:hypothetical protein BH09VER1_BH09VER1_45700 [soil metagenome]
MPFKEFDIVRIRKIVRLPETYDGWGLNQQPPRVGDTGTITDILHTPDQPDHYVVERTFTDGATIWLSEFTEEEIEPTAS